MDVEVHDKQSYYLFSIWHLIATLASLLSSVATCSELSYMRRRVSEPLVEPAHGHWSTSTKKELFLDKQRYLCQLLGLGLIAN